MNARICSRLRVCLLAMAATAMWGLPVFSDNVKYYYGSTDLGSIRPTVLSDPNGPPTVNCAVHGEVKEIKQWTYSKTDSDGTERGPKLTAADRRCDLCSEESKDVDVTIGHGHEIEKSASTSWTVGVDWSIIKEVLGVNASFTNENSTSFTQSDYVEVTIPVTCISPKCKKSGHYVKFDLDISTYQGPVSNVHYHLVQWQGWTYLGTCATTDTYTAVLKTRVVMTSSERVFEDEAHDCNMCTCPHCQQKQ